MCALPLISLALVVSSGVLLVMLANQQLSTTQAFKGSNNTHIGPNGSAIQFILFTKNYPPFNLKIGNNSDFQLSGFNSSNPTKIIIHGFLSSIKDDIFILHKNAYLDSGSYNIIGMDWSVLCEFEYFSSLLGARKAGNLLGDFINWLIDNEVNLDDIHLIGHSLGAHVAGIGANKVKHGRLGRITGLDPAGPGFNDIQTDMKLDQNDAKLVDVVHTYIKILSLAQPLGHVDFYPNGGRFQPGCPTIYDVWKIAESLTCNHARAYYFFTESILNKKAFKSKKCHTIEDALSKQCTEDTQVYMGQVETYENGLYYFQTRPKFPYTLSDVE